MYFLVSTIISILRDLNMFYSYAWWWVGAMKGNQTYADYESSGPDPIYWVDGTGKCRHFVVVWFSAADL